MSRRFSAGSTPPNLAYMVAHAPSHNTTALAVPQQGVNFDYEELDKKASALATALCSHGLGLGDGLFLELQNTAENLILQLACARLGVTAVTAKTLADTDEKMNIKAAAVSAESPLASESSLPLPPLVVTGGVSGEFKLQDGAVVYEEALANEENYTNSVLFPKAPEVGDDGGLHAMFGKAKLTQGEILNLGRSCREKLDIGPGDKICVSITLCHAYGIGTAVAGAFSAGATVVLPAVGGIRGCGNPAQRAEVTLDVLKSENCTLLFADSHTLKALPPTTEGDLPSLRGGVVKIGSGSDFLDGVTSATIGGETRELVVAGKQMLAMGKAA